jgi:hypothetical protein
MRWQGDFLRYWVLPDEAVSADGSRTGQITAAATLAAAAPSRRLDLSGLTRSN